jgi:hypothetical protein
MAGKKISELPALGSTYAGTDLFEISVDGGGGSYSSKSITGANISSSAAASVQTIYNTSASLLAARTVTMGAYDLNFASTTAGQKVTLGKNVSVGGQAYSDGIVTLTPGATVTPDWNDGNIQSVIIDQVGVTMANPTNIQIGATYILVVVQDGTGSRTITTWGSAYEFPANTAPTLTTTADRADVITLVAYNANTLMCTSVLDFTIN